MCDQAGVMFATNLPRAVERAGKQWTWKENKYTRWIFFPLTIQKYNSTIVNLGMYISLGNRENCNKCISAFVYTFWSKELHKPSEFFFFLLLHWHNENDGTRLACCLLQVNVNIWKLATESMRYIGKMFENVHVNELTDVILPPIQTKKNVWLQPDWVESCIFFLSTLTSPELIRAAWITLDGWSVPHAHSWGISSIGTFQRFWTYNDFVILSL